MNIGILREGRTPPDHRVPLLPTQCAQLLAQYPNVRIFIQPSHIRCVPEVEYAQVGVVIQEDMSACDILLGVKEVNIDELLPQKTYLFFSHTIKKQPYNQKLLARILELGIRLIDYECLTDTAGNRLVAFGRFAGIVGAYNALWTYGTRYGYFDLPRAYTLPDYAALQAHLHSIKLPRVRIVLTGTGRVGRGAAEVLEEAGIRRVSPMAYLHEEYQEAVYTILESSDYYQARDGQAFSREHFHQSPEAYKAVFLPFARRTDILITGHYWNPKAELLFKLEDMRVTDFGIHIIADISCDVCGSVPCTLRTSSILAPVYDYNTRTQQIELAFSHQHHLTIMAIDNLPGELPRDASATFGEQLLKYVFPALLRGEQADITTRATIAESGRLTPFFEYLSDYAYA